MLYTDEFGRDHELPKYDVAMRRRFEKAAQATGEERLKAEHEAVRACLGADAAKGLLDGADFAHVDLTRLETAFQGIQSAYGAPAAEAQRRSINDALSALDGEQLEKLTSFVDAMGAMGEAQRRGFRMVK